MSNNNLPSSTTLRFLGLINHPQSELFTQNQIRDPFELHESDVVWSFSAVSPDSYPHRDSTATSPLSHHDHRNRFNSAKSGLSAALSDDHHHLIRRKSTLNHKMISPAARFPQSVPVNIPLWRKKGDVIRVDEVEDDEIEGEGEEEMVPPHVIVARSHVTFSVFEGAGRTLKGRDLRRVRNAVFQKTESKVSRGEEVNEAIVSMIHPCLSNTISIVFDDASEYLVGDFLFNLLMLQRVSIENAILFIHCTCSFTKS